MKHGEFVSISRQTGQICSSVGQNMRLISARSIVRAYLDLRMRRRNQNEIKTIHGFECPV